MAFCPSSINQLRPSIAGTSAVLPGDSSAGRATPQRRTTAGSPHATACSWCTIRGFAPLSWTGSSDSTCAHGSTVAELDGTGETETTADESEFCEVDVECVLARAR